jgi:hypothetical protein
MLRNAPRLRRGALLIRGPRAGKESVGPGSAQQRTGRCCASPGERCIAFGTRDYFRYTAAGSNSRSASTNDKRVSPSAVVTLRSPSGVTGRTGLLDTDPDRVLIAIHPHLDHALGLSGAFAFSPQRIARTAEVPGIAARDRPAQGFVVHMRDHQHVAARGIGGHAGHQTRRIEFGLECQPLFAIMGVCGCRHGQPRKM